MVRKKLRVGIVAAGLMILTGPAAFAAVRPHALISDGMVLQQGMKVPIWGTADDGEQVTVHFQDRQFQTTAKDGRWMIWLDDLNAGGPFEMTIHGSNTIRLQNVLVGEVWICSGQSNMEWPLAATAQAERTLRDSTNPRIRLFTVPHTAASVPLHRVQGSWQACGPQTVPHFSAVGYFFGRDLQKALHVPVGLIHTSWGGTPAEAWTSLAALEAEPSLRYLAEQQTRALKNYPGVLDHVIRELESYKAAVVKAEAEGKNLPDPPPALANLAKNPWTAATLSNPARNPGAAATLYNGMIAPLIPYAFRGAIWYQGESNVGRAYEYRTLLPTMIKNWRNDWKEGDFPFLIVQLAPFLKIEKEPQESAWAELREAQLLTTQKVPNTAEAVISDVGEEYDIHPRRKAPVGARLALAARALAYGEKIEYSGPAYSGMKVEGDKAVLSFTHVDGGLVARGGPLAGFTIAGKDRKFVRAEAEIRGDQVVVSSPQVEHPEAVRYGWANYPVVNLWNKAGLPASPFRTDDFPMLTNPQHRAAAAKP